MLTWGEGVTRSVTSQFGNVNRMKRGLILLAAAACTAAALLYWRQQTDEHDRRPIQASYGYKEDPQWSWICRHDRCERVLTSETSILQSLATCNMLCASTLLWPQPTGPVSLATAAIAVRAESFKILVMSSPSVTVTNHLNDAFALTKEDLRLLERSGASFRRSDLGTADEVLVKVYVNGSADPRLKLDTNESYTLKLQRTGRTLMADITARSFCGARHGIETLSQLVWYDPYSNTLLMLQTAVIQDEPRFHYRGLLLDTARNFFPVHDILRTIDAMGASKLNTFHWHLTDSQSFPLQLESVPQLAEWGAYSPRAVYSSEDVRTVVRRAALRGVRVLLEVDAPAHVGRAWSWGPAHDLGHLAYCVEAEPWSAYCGEPPCGQLNPRNPHVYVILEKIYAEILKLTGVDDVFHLGGDEVSETCWLQHFNDTDPMELWLDFTEKSMQALKKANGGKLPQLTLLWSSKMTREPYLAKLDPSKYGIQVWGSSRWTESRDVVDAGYRTVLSHVDAWYLDCGFGSWRDSTEGHCSPYRSWQQVYEHRPWAEEMPGVPRRPHRIVGGAACQWSEQLGQGGLDARMWPRAAALAERLWSDRAEGALPDVYLRLDTHRSRLWTRGVAAAPLWPRWCTYNPSACL